MRVVAIKKGFSRGAWRRRPGDIFEMSEAEMRKVPFDKVKPGMRIAREDKEAKVAYVLPDWVDEVKDDDSAKKAAAKAQRDAVMKNVRAAVAASGGQAARNKIERAGEDLV